MQRHGSYNVQLAVQNAFGCVDTVIHIIQIDPIFTFYIPNAFSPNDDGDNDYFNGKGVGIVKYKLMIFDRWGDLIFVTEKLDDKGWDGIVSGGDAIAQQDTYVWKVLLTDEFKAKHAYKGVVNLVR